MSRRFKSRTMRFGVPLSIPGSRCAERCYGRHGIAFAATPPLGSNLEKNDSATALSQQLRRRLMLGSRRCERQNRSQSSLPYREPWSECTIMAVWARLNPEFRDFTESLIAEQAPSLVDPIEV